MTVLGSSAFGQRVSYPPFDRSCIDSQVLNHLAELNRYEREDFVSLALRVCKEKADLRRLLISPDTNQRSLGAFGWLLTHDDKQTAIEVLIASLKDGGPSIRARSAHALGRVLSDDEIYLNPRPPVPGQVVAALTQALGDREVVVRIRSALSLIRLGKKFSELAPALIEALQDEHAGNRIDAAVALRGIGKDFPTVWRTVVPALIAALKDRDPSVRSKAAEAIGEIGKNADTAVPALIPALEDRNEDVRLAAVEALGKFRVHARPAIPRLIAVLARPENSRAKNSRFTLFISAAVNNALRRIGRTAVPPLIAAMKDVNARETAIETLELFGGEARSAVPDLMALLNDEEFGFPAAKALARISKDVREVDPLLRDAFLNRNRTVRLNAAKGLTGFSPDMQLVVPFFISALGNPDSMVRSDAAFILGTIGLKAIPLLTEASKNNDVRSRSGVLLAFWHMSIAKPGLKKQADITQSVVPTLRVALRDSDEVVRYRAMLALKAWELKATEVSSLPPSALKDEDKYLRVAAALELFGTDLNLDQDIHAILIEALSLRALPPFTGKENEAVFFLITALKNPDHRVRANAALTLHEMEGAAGPSAPALIEALGDKEADVHSAACRALLGIGVDIKPALPSLIAIVNPQDVFDRDCVESNLARIGPEAIEALIKMLDGTNSKLRIYAAESLGRMGEKAKAAFPFLSKALKDPDANVRQAAVNALTKIWTDQFTREDARPAIPYLIEALKDENEANRHAVALLLRKLAQYGTPELISGLRNQNTYVRKGVAFALGNIKPLPGSADEALKEIAEDGREDLETRRVAAWVLQESGVNMDLFFRQNNLIAPRNIVCRAITWPHGTAHFNFDLYLGRCVEVTYLRFDSGGSSLFDYIKKLFGA